MTMSVIEQARKPTGPANEALELFQLKQKLTNTKQLLKMARREIVRLREVMSLIDADLRRARIKAKWDAACARLVMPKRLHREINFHLHPDRWEGDEAKQRAEKCFTEFNALHADLREE
jgi:hypothetical protein